VSDDASSTRARAETLARDASEAFDQFLRGESVSREPADGFSIPARDGATRSIESGSDWLTRVRRDYRAVVDRLSEDTVPNPVVDAARALAAENNAVYSRNGSGTIVHRSGDGDRVVTIAEPGLLGWLNHGFSRFQNEVVGKLVADTAPQRPGVRELLDGRLPAATVAPPQGETSEPEAAQQSAGVPKTTSEISSSANSDAGREGPSLTLDAEPQPEVIVQSPETKRAGDVREDDDDRRDLESTRLAKVRGADEARKIEDAQKLQENSESADATRLAAQQVGDEAREAEEARMLEDDQKATSLGKLAALNPSDVLSSIAAEPAGRDAQTHLPEAQKYDLAKKIAQAGAPYRRKRSGLRSGKSARSVPHINRPGPILRP